MLSITLLYFLILFLGGCSIFPNSSSSSSQIVLQQIPRARLTYVAIGASDTFGIGADDPSTQSWPSDLAARLGSDVRLVNLGVPGILVHDALNVELPVALDTHPNLITIWLVVNDIANKVPLNTYLHDLDLLLSRLQVAAPQAHILVANSPDLTLLPYFANTDSQALSNQVQNYNTGIATLVNNHRMGLVDLYQQWHELRAHPEFISNDGLHPSTPGYAQLADLFYQKYQNIAGS